MGNRGVRGGRVVRVCVCVVVVRNKGVTVRGITPTV